jgi:DNA modification methylase
MEVNKIIEGNALQMLKTLPDKSIDCCITSPPYWGLRDYGHDEQLGNEKTFKEFIDNLCNIFDEIKRVLKDEGTCFVNLGDGVNLKKVGEQQNSLKTKVQILFILKSERKVYQINALT